MFRAGGAVPESAEPDSPVAGVAVDTGSGQRDVKFNKRAARERIVALNFGSAHRERLLEKEIIMPDVTGALGTVVLVHGGFVDASGWEDVYKILKKDGYNVSVVQNPTSSLADDVAATTRALEGEKAPVMQV